jgi:CheY-like chemotaxis protein
MFDADEKRWIQSTANELNNLFQVISESVRLVRNFCSETPESQKYFDILRASIERAAIVTSKMHERAGTAPSVAATAAPAPAAAQAPAAASKPAPKSPVSSDELDDFDFQITNPDGRRELILVVDDEEFVTLLAKEVLTDEGYRVVTARDGMEALKIYKKLKDQISLVILDFTMPILDGSDVFDEMREINPKVCVVLSSGFTEQEKLKSMLANGLRGFIPKPYSHQKLLAQVRSTLDALQSQQRA